MSNIDMEILATVLLPWLVVALAVTWITLALLWLNRSCVFHKWTRWGDPKPWQSRRCERCNRVEQRDVRSP